ncbi:MAG: NAD(P)H-hydrate dehydratase [Candidatus Diapherotrites archaeon]
MKENSFVSVLDLRKCLKRRDPEAHKGENGVVLIIGGSIDYSGSLYLAGMSALRSGVDLVRIFAPEKAALAVNNLSPDLISIKFKGNYFDSSAVEKALELTEQADAVLLGNGLTLNEEAVDFAREFIQECPKPLILDADAIKVCSGLKLNEFLLTPHSKEFELCFSSALPKELEQKIELVKDTARKFNCIILLKGRIDIIASPSQLKLNSTGNPRMAVAGTGDTLAGLCAGFAAQKNSSFDSACAAAFLNGKAGETAFKEKGNSFIASELIEAYPAILKGKK